MMAKACPVQRTHLIEKGVLTAFAAERPVRKTAGPRAERLCLMGFGEPPGVSTSNLHVAPGPQRPAALMQRAGRGLLVTDMFGPSVNPNTGDFSVGVAGFWFDGGEIAYPVSEVTVAGDLHVDVRAACAGL